MVNTSEVPIRSGGENSMSMEAPDEYRARRSSSLIDNTYTHTFHIIVHAIIRGLVQKKYLSPRRRLYLQNVHQLTSSNEQIRLMQRSNKKCHNLCNQFEIPFNLN